MVRAGTKRKQLAAAAPADTEASKKKNVVTAANANANANGAKKQNGHDAASDKASSTGGTPPPPPAKRGRGRPPTAKGTDEVAAKKRKVAPSAPERAPLGFRLGDNKFGVVLTVGQGDTGQLGLGEDTMERSKPGVVKDVDDVVDICAGGMHTVCLDKEGHVYTFGCNDEGALGRTTEDDDECYSAAKVDLPLADGEKVVQISAGDSHSVALTSAGKVYYWGTFRDSSGSFGLTPRGIEKLPIPLCHELDVKKVASGADHVAILTQTGELYTVGCGEQGQLGRVGERFVARGGRRGVSLLLTADKVHAKNRRIVFTDVWAGSYSTYAQTVDKEIFVCGLNNYNQLGIDKGNVFFTLVKSGSFSDLSKETDGLKCVAPGQHHAVVLDRKGRAHAIGRVEYGRLGLGEESKTDAKVPTPIPALSSKAISDVACGTAVSFAVSNSGEVFSWGMGTNGQLALDGEDDVWQPEKMLGKQLENKEVLLASGGGQHTVLLARPRE